MLSKYFSYYNYKITQNIDIPILFFKKSVPEQSVRHTCQICNSVFFLSYNGLYHLVAYADNYKSLAINSVLALMCLKCSDYTAVCVNNGDWGCLCGIDNETSVACEHFESCGCNVGNAVCLTNHNFVGCA